MLMSPTLVALLLEWAAGFDKIVFLTVLAGAFKFMQRGRGGVSPSGAQPSSEGPWEAMRVIPLVEGLGDGG